MRLLRSSYNLSSNTRKSLAVQIHLFPLIYFPLIKNFHGLHVLNFYPFRIVNIRYLKYRMLDKIKAVPIPQ
jgi:hypothetical protein